jgi:3-methylcrotonyl-CoA carboxylase alpha subunit
MEMNTRLQVEHPVTEEITGQDLVEWQLRVASGEKLPKRQDELSINGHAIEARLYAEDPAKGFLPSVGRLEHFDLGDDGRIETGVEEGDAISPFYDPMIAKLIAAGETRDEARLELVDMCRSVRISPMRTNAAFLSNCLSDADFASGAIDTGLIDRKGDVLTARQATTNEEAAAGALLVLEAFVQDEMLLPVLEAGGGRAWVIDETASFNPLLGFRLNARPQRQVKIEVDGEPIEIDLDVTGPRQVPIYDFVAGGAWAQSEDGAAHLFRIERRPRGTGTTHGLHDGEIEAPMPGKVTAVEVSAGEKVEKGQRLLTLEAMKMEHALTAPFDGTVAELPATAGAQVKEGQLLVKVDPVAAAD